MSLVEQMRQAITDAMKAKESVRLDAARMAHAALKNREIDKKGPLEELEAQKVIASLIKQRRESIEQFRKGGREELAEKEEQEKAFLETFLPPPLDEAEIAKEVDRIIAENKAAGPKDFGKVMKPVMAALGARADGAIVKRIVQERLGS